MKEEIKYYREIYTKLKLRHVVPKFSFSKNVQGWSFTRNYTIHLLRYAITYSIVLMSDINISRNCAHEINVKKYMYVNDDVIKTVFKYLFIGLGIGSIIALILTALI